MSVNVIIVKSKPVSVYFESISMGWAVLIDVVAAIEGGRDEVKLNSL